MLHESLIAEIQRELEKWAYTTRIYGTFSVIDRVFLIIATAIVAAERNLVGSYGNFLVKLVPLLALIVTIATALDTWLKPREKWRGFMEDRDELTDLILRIKATPPTDTASLDSLREEFKMLRHRHREKNVR